MCEVEYRFYCAVTKEGVSNTVMSKELRRGDVIYSPVTCEAGGRTMHTSVEVDPNGITHIVCDCGLNTQVKNAKVVIGR